MTDYSKGYKELGTKRNKVKTPVGWDYTLLKGLSEVSGINHKTIMHNVIDFVLGKPVMANWSNARSKKQRERFKKKRYQERHE